MAGVKGNDGKAASSRLATQLLAVLCLAVVAVVAVKTFGTGSWHAGATMDDHQIHQEATEVVAARVAVADPDHGKTELPDDVQYLDTNLIKFVFSSLDGEEGNEGEVVVRLRPDWAPIGVKRIKELTLDHFWDGCRAFRVLPNFVVQLGINGDPEKQKKWQHKIEDDPVNASNKRGTVTFAMAGRGTRTTQIFFNKGDNRSLDNQNFSPVGEVVRGMEVIDQIYAGYREKPDQGFIQQRGNEYLEKNFPKLSYIKTGGFDADIEGVG